MSTLDSVWATSDDRSKADEGLTSTQNSKELQAKKEARSEPSTSPATATTSTLDSRWATSYDTFKSEHGLPATKFSETLAQRRSDLHPEESNQPLTLIDEQEDKTAQDWRSNSDRTRRGYNPSGRSSYNGSTSPRQYDSYQSWGSFRDRDRTTNLSANATPWYPDSTRRQQRQPPQPSQYEPISSRPWNMIAMKKKLPSPSSETSTEVDLSKTEGQRSWSGSTSRSSWADERKNASWAANNRTEFTGNDKPTADEAWNEHAIAKEVSIPVAPVVTYKVTTNSVSRDPSTESPVQITSTSQFSLNNDSASNDTTTSTANGSPSNWNASGSAWDPSNVPWDNEPVSPEPSWKNDQSTKRKTWTAPANQANEPSSTTQPYSITVSLRSQPPENSNIRISTSPPTQPNEIQESVVNSKPSTTMDKYAAQSTEESWDPAKEATWNSKPQPSAAQPSNRSTWGPTESSSRQTQERFTFEQMQPARVISPQTSWSNSEYQTRDVPRKSHQTTTDTQNESSRADNSEYVLPPSTSCRPWDVDKYKHRLWEQ